MGQNRSEGRLRAELVDPQRAVGAAEELVARWHRHRLGTEAERMMCEGYLQALALLFGLTVAQVRSALLKGEDDAARTAPHSG